MHKAGFVNIVGNPNVGKSTLMNQLVGERISIATFKAQTTRHRIMGIVNTDDMQIVFSDTPGVLKPNYKMQEMMLAFSESALADADVLLYYDKEIPYSVEVRVERFKEDEHKIHINAVIYVERDSQKGIIIGHQGIALKKVNTESRKALEKFFDKKIFLETFVKVDKDWRSSQKELDAFGYNPE